MNVLFTILYYIVLTVIIYFVLTFLLTILLAKGPRRPVDDVPDWGVLEDHIITTHTNASIECWVVYPDGTDLSTADKHEVAKNIPAVVLTHGWGRNRDRMTARARQWGKLGFTTILFSVRNHGNSSRERIGMSIVKFSHDIDDIVKWWGRPVIILGHSIGGGASILVAGRDNLLIRAVVAEAPVRAIPKDLNAIYQPLFKKFTPFFIIGLRFAISVVFFRYRSQGYSPIINAERISIPTLLIHGKLDDLLPSTFSEDLHKVIKHSTLCIFENADHSNIPEQAEYFECIRKFVDNNLLNQSN